MVSPTYRYRWEFQPFGLFLRVFLWFVTGFYAMLTMLALPDGFHWWSTLTYAVGTVWFGILSRWGGLWHLCPEAMSWDLPLFFSIFIDSRTIAPDSSRVPQ